MAKSSNELSETLFESIDAIVGQRIKSLPYDQTIVCQIVDATEHADGIYTVTHDYNTTFKAYADSTGFNENDYVYVRIPEGDYTQQKVITGKYLDGIIVAGETHNILSNGDKSYYDYDKNNLIHNYYWSKTEHEIIFKYFNSVYSDKVWTDVISQYTNGNQTYERPKALKLTIGSNNNVVVYIHKYKEVNNTESADLFAAEQDGVTSSGWMLNIVRNNMDNIDMNELDGDASYIELDKDKIKFSFTKITSSNKDIYLIQNDEGNYSINDNYKYFILEDNKYKYQKTPNVDNITNYYVFVDESAVPADIILYQLENDNYVAVNRWDLNLNKAIYYSSPKKLFIDLSNSNLPMLKAMVIYMLKVNNDYELHIRYQIASEFVPEQSSIPVTLSFCPIDEAYNVSSTVNLYFGYLTELPSDLNGIIQLIRIEDGVEEAIQAILKDDYKPIKKENVKYKLKLLVADKTGNFISSKNFKYKWENNNISSEETYEITLGNNFFENPVPIIYTVILYINQQQYKTFHYPIALSYNSECYVDIPTLIEYNEAGVNPQYYDNIITIKNYREENSEIEYSIVCDEATGIINNNIFCTYNYLNEDKEGYLKILDNENNLLWYQSLYFYKKQPRPYIQSKNIPLGNNSGDGSAGALAAQATSNSGLSIRHNANVLSISEYNNNQQPQRVFHLDSNGNLEVGYNNFTMTGHITEGARYLENFEKQKYNPGDENTPVYFKNGIPMAMRQLFEISHIKIIPEYNTSVITNATLGNGRFVKCSTNTTFTLPVNAAIGYECEIYKQSSNENVKIVFQSANNNIKLYSIDTPNGVTQLQLTEPRGVVVIKKISDTEWLFTGAVEEVTQ